MESLVKMLICYAIVTLVILPGVFLNTIVVELQNGAKWNMSSTRGRCSASEQCTTAAYCREHMNIHLGHDAVSCGGGRNFIRRQKRYCCPVGGNPIYTIQTNIPSTPRKPQETSDRKALRLPNGSKWRISRSGGDKACAATERCTTAAYCSTYLNRNLGRDAVLCQGRRGFIRTRQRKYCCPVEENSIDVPQTVVQSTTRRPRQISNYQECGSSKPINIRTPLIKGGEYAKEGSFLWMAALVKRNRRKGTYRCGAFLFDRRHLLTAAHCFEKTDSLNPQNFYVRMGNREWRKGRRFNVAKITVHPGYRSPEFYDDIAVLTLEEEVTDPNIIPVCLPNKAVASITTKGQGTTVAGWGAEYNGELNIMLSRRLKYLSALPIISNEECYQRLRRYVPGFRRLFHRKISRGFLCAGFLEGGKDSCKGDSGGPLMIQYGGRYYAVGIVSFGYGCGKPGYPAGYTNITEYKDFIMSVV